jgi:BirA family biotin operon repressor/biotin-[acetyl-CoA-carboxylase] ligase
MNPVGSPFIELQSVDSTNNYALGRIHSGLADAGTVFFAHEQTAGKGQWGKSWASGRGMNIMMSALIRPLFLLPFQQFRLSAAIAIAVHDLFKKYAGDGTSIKWPNDLYWRDRKAGGILIENIITTKNHRAEAWEWAVAGIGININQTGFSPELPNPVSLKQITGKDHDPVQLARELCNNINGSIEKLEGGNFSDTLRSFNDILYKKDQAVKLKKASRVFEAVIKGIDENGFLIVQHAVEERFNFGEVEWLK